MNESICTGQNDVRLNEAEEHVVALEGQAGEFGSILTDAKEPAARSLEAAQAYDNIAKAMAEADERAQEARNDAEASPISGLCKEISCMFEFPRPLSTH